MPEEARKVRIFDPVDMTGLDEFFPSHDKTGQEDLTLEEAAKRLNLSERTIQRRLKSGQLTGYKVEGNRGPEWRIRIPASDDMTLHAIPTSDDTPFMSDVTTEAETVSSVDTTRVDTSSNVAAFAPFAEFLQTQIQNLQGKLEAATYRNGYLEAQLTTAESQLKLLPDLSAKATEADLLREQVQQLELKLKSSDEQIAELLQQKKGFWHKFGAWFIGQKSQ